MAQMNPMRRYREKRHLSQEKLAEAIGVSSVTISRWETGARVPQPKLWPKIKQATGITVNADDFRSRMEAAE